jgi:hypothetical protein
MVRVRYRLLTGRQGGLTMTFVLLGKVIVPASMREFAAS